MFGITTSDAIALGSMIAALMAACVGLLRGDQARADRSEHRSDGGHAVGGVDDLADAVRELVNVLRTAVAIASSTHQLTATIEELLHRNNRHQS